MTIQIGAPPYGSPIADENGMLTMDWVMWFQQMTKKIAGPDNSELNNSLYFQLDVNGNVEPKV